MPSAVDPRRRVVIDALGVGLGTATYGVAFGATAVTSGFRPMQAMVLSLVMFTGGSQFALVSVLSSGGTVAAALSVAWVLGARNGLYGIRVRELLPRRWAPRMVSAHLVLDESMAMAVTRPTTALARLAFWSTGLSVFVLWNLATLLGALGGTLIDDPSKVGLDAAFPAGFVALVWPLIRGREAVATAGMAIAIALLLIPLTPAGVPVLACVLAPIAVVAFGRRGATRSAPAGGQASGQTGGPAGGQAGPR